MDMLNSRYLTTTARAVLRQTIRNAKEPDNPALIRQFLNWPPDIDEYSIASRRAYLSSQFQLLLETIADECLPPHWRCQCLDHINLPLYALARLANCSVSKQQVHRLSHELHVISHYLKFGLSA